MNTIVAWTAAAAYTETAAVVLLSAIPTLTASNTPVPSKTPSPTPSATPTFRFILPTLTRSPTPITPTTGYACTLLSQSPDHGSTMAANSTFQAKWTVRNTGDQGWDNTSVDFIYSSGAKLSKLKAADLPTSVSMGNKITLTISMTAPGSSDTYKTVWTLRAGKTEFCKLTMSIIVK